MISGTFLLGCAGVFIAFPALCVQSFSDGLHLCANSLLPALFPFFIVSTLLLESPAAVWLAQPLHPLCRILGCKSRKAPLLLLLGWLGGYTALAAGAALCSRRREITPDELSRLLPAGVICSPGFASAVGGIMLGRPILGVFLYASNLVAGVLCGLIVRIFCGCKTTRIDFLPSSTFSSSSPQGLSGAVSDAVHSSLLVCGNVIFFRMLLALMDLFLPTGIWQALAAGSLEISSGCRIWAAQPGSVSIPGCCGCLSILSLSVWCQLHSLSQGAYSLRSLALTRPFHLVFSLLFLSIILRVFPESSPAVHSYAARVLLRRRLPGDRALLLFVFCCLILDQLEKASLYKKGNSSYTKNDFK